MNSGSNYDPRYNAKVYIPKAQRHVPVTPVEAPEPAPKATPQKPQQAHRAVRTLRISPQRQNAVTTESPIYGGKKRETRPVSAPNNEPHWTLPCTDYRPTPRGAHQQK